MNRFLFLCALLFSSVAAQAACFSGHFFNLPIVVMDTIPPVLVCPVSDTLQLPPNACDSALTYLVTVSDDLPGATFTQTAGLASDSAFPIGTTTCQFLATDTTGNTATCAFSITVQAHIGAPLVCKDQIYIHLGANCMAMAQPAEALEPGEYGCLTNSNYVASIDKTPPYGNGPWLPPMVDASDLGKNYAYRIQDITANYVCWGLVRIEPDNVTPVITCTTVSVPCALPDSMLTPAKLALLGVLNHHPVITDNCGILQEPTYTDVFQNVLCSQSSTVSAVTNRTWTVTDLANNASSCVQVIERVRTFNQIEFPATDTISCANANYANTAALFSGTPALRFGNVLFSLLPQSYCEFDINFEDELVVLCDGSRLLNRTWKIYNFCALSMPPLTHVQQIYLLDRTKPVLHCPEKVVIPASVTNCTASADLPDIVIDDACSHINSVYAQWLYNGDTITLGGSLANFAANNPAISDTLGVFGMGVSFVPGINIVQYIAIDGCGNTGSCTTSLEIWSGEPPVAVCRPLMQILLKSNGTQILPATALDNGSSDACVPVILRARRLEPDNCQPDSVFTDSLRFCCQNIGDTILINLRAYNIETPAAANPGFATNQYATCTVQVVVQDTVPLRCIAPENKTLTCAVLSPTLAQYGMPVTTCKVDSLSEVPDYSQFNAMCGQGIIRREFRVFDLAGHSSSCVQQITVAHDQNYAIRFPDDKIITACTPGNLYGTPQFNGIECELMQVTYTDQLFTVVPDACYKIERTWTIINTCTYDSTKALITIPNPTPQVNPNNPLNLPGPIVAQFNTPAPWAPTVVALIPTALPINYSTFWQKNANGYQYKQIIKIQDTQDPVTVCPSSTTLDICDYSLNDTAFWNKPYWVSLPGNGHDKAESSVNLTLKGTDACVTFAPLAAKYDLYLDLDQNGTQETRVNNYQIPPPPAGMVVYNNINGPSETREFDNRAVPANLKYTFSIDVQLIGDTTVAKVVWRNIAFPNEFVEPQLPLGTHKIRWIVTDACGNDVTCEYSFKIESCCAAPVITCKAALPVEITPAQSAKITPQNLIEDLVSNCTNPGDLQLSLRKAGTGTGFPLSAAGTPIEQYFFTCSDVGTTQDMEVWVRDTVNNTGMHHCTIPVSITDPINWCSQQVIKYSVGGTLKNVSGAPISGWPMVLNVDHPNLDSFDLYTNTDANGHFLWPDTIPAGSNYWLRSSFEGDYLNGVTTYDLVLINQHILNLVPLDSPFKILAADANRSGTITSFDIVELRKMILGIYLKLPNSPSWRFVDASIVFDPPNNPFSSLPYDNIRLLAMQEDRLEEDLTAFKVGDVNASATYDSLLVNDDRGPAVLFKIKPIDGGVEISPAPTAQAWQFSLNLNGLELLDIEPVSDNITPDHFAYFKAQNVLTASWNGTTPPCFRLRFKGSDHTDLAHRLAFSDQITRSEAYGISGDRKHIALDWSKQTDQPALYPNTPNPFDAATSIGFFLPEATNATLIVTDMTGRVLWQISGAYTAGMHQQQLAAQQLADVYGVLTVQLVTEQGILVQKMIRSR